MRPAESRRLIEYARRTFSRQAGSRRRDRSSSTIILPTEPARSSIRSRRSLSRCVVCIVRGNLGFRAASSTAGISHVRIPSLSRFDRRRFQPRSERSFPKMVARTRQRCKYGLADRQPLRQGRRYQELADEADRHLKSSLFAIAYPLTPIQRYHERLLYWSNVRSARRRGTRSDRFQDRARSRRKSKDTEKLSKFRTCLPIASSVNPSSMEKKFTNYLQANCGRIYATAISSARRSQGGDRLDRFGRGDDGVRSSA